jgi:hypothetical protein
VVVAHGEVDQLGPAGNRRAVPGVPRGVKRIILVVAICVALTAALAATYIIPRADPIYRIAEQTVKSAGPTGVKQGLPQ